MNLRHKKPINSYRGQANNDRNEFNDDDFKHQPSIAKKFNNPSGEQIFKYSKILAKFIMNANQYYRQKGRVPKKQKVLVDNISESPKPLKDQTRNNNFLRQNEQLKQKRKIIPKIQNAKLQSQQLKSKQIYKQDFQIKNQKIINEIDSDKDEIMKGNTKTSTINSDNFSPKPSTVIPEQKTETITPQNYMTMFPMNYPAFSNPNMYPNIPMNPMASMNPYMINYSQMMKMALLQQYMKDPRIKDFNGNPSFNPQLMNYMGTPDILRNMLQYNMQHQQQPNRINQNIIKPAPLVHNLTQAFLTQKQSIFNTSKQNPNKIAKRSSVHIGIAYHIYMEQIKKKGIDISNPLQIDPTKHSRTIKQKQQNNKNKQKSQKKK